MVIVVGTARTFDPRVAIASRWPDIVSPEMTPTTSTATDAPTNVPAVIFSKEQLSMDEFKAMVSQTRGFYTRDYSLGLGWNNARFLFDSFLLFL